MRKVFLAVTLVVVLFGTLIFADPALTVSGTIALKNTDSGFAFTLEEVKALAATSYQVTDPWLGDKLYEGVTISEVLKYVGVPSSAKKIFVICSDKKEFEVAYADIVQFPIMLAYNAKSRAIPASQGGPLKLVYPINDFPQVLKIYPAENWAWYVVGMRVEM